MMTREPVKERRNSFNKLGPMHFTADFIRGPEFFKRNVATKSSSKKVSSLSKKTFSIVVTIVKTS